MVNTYTPAYYSSLHDTITSICKTILPFSFKKRRLAAGQKLSKQQSDNLKWQQESFHRILNLIGLQKEGMVQETEVSGFRSQLLETLIASPPNQEEPTIIRDKLIFLQELFYAKCISDDEYHSSKRPLLQRLAVQGAEIEARDVILAGPPQKKIEEEDEEEWSDIDFKGEECLMGKEKSQNSDKSKHRSPMKRIKGAVKLVSPFSSDKNKGNGKGGVNQAAATSSSTGNQCARSFSENPFWELPSKQKETETQSILMAESGVTEERAEKSVKKKKKQWGFDVGFKKWKRGDKEENLHEEKENAAPLTTTSLTEGERRNGEGETPCRLVSKPLGEGPDTKQIKRKIHSDGSASDFFIDKVLGDNIKKELSRIQTELCTTNPNLSFSNDQIDAISTRLPVDKADLKKFFPKSWCDRYGDIVLDVVRKEFKDHVGEMENLRNNSSAAYSTTTTTEGDKEKNTQGNSSKWVMFDEENNTENYHPNLFASAAHYDHDQNPNHSKCFENNPFLEDGVKNKEQQMKLRQSRPEQNPFWSPSATAAAAGGGHI